MNFTPVSGSNVSTITPRRRTRRRRSSLLRVIEQLSDDQVLLCSCDERHLACAG